MGNSNAAGRMIAVANGSLSVCGAKETNSNQIASHEGRMIAWVRETRRRNTMRWRRSTVTPEPPPDEADKAPVPPGATVAQATGPPSGLGNNRRACR